MYEIVRRWEAFLRLERLTNASDLFKARTVYAASIGFCLVQIANLVQMYLAYGGWIFDHSLLLGAVTIFCVSAVSLRYHSNFDMFSVIWGGVILLGVGGTAIPSNVGINSALLPVLVTGIVIIALLGSRRSLIIYCASASLLTLCLHINAGQADISQLSDPAYVALRNSQRTTQTLIAIVMAGLVLGLMATAMNGLFRSLEQSLADARAADAAKTQFLADMSHELRTPLNGVLGMNQLLLRTDLNDMQRNYAQVVNDCGSGMIAVIDDILDLSRLEADKVKLTPTAFDPSRMLESLIALHQANARAKDIELYLNIEPGLPDMFMGDHGRLRQILGNLVGNAVKFTDTGYVAVSMRAQDLGNGRWWLNFFVQDTGIGITPDRQARIFDRFEQAQDGQKNTVRGSGLGLSICRELTDLFKGEISVTSTPGDGSCFCVAFALEAVELEKTAPETEDAVAIPVVDAPQERVEAAASENIDSASIDLASTDPEMTESESDTESEATDADLPLQSVA